MNTKPGNLLFRSPIRWLAAAGAAATLMVPLAASADHQTNDLAGIVASAAVAYVVVDAVGGFDNDKKRRHRSDRKYYRDPYSHDRRAHHHPGRGYDHRDNWNHGRAHRARTEHWRQHAYNSHKRAHRQNHQHDQRRHQNPYRKHHSNKHHAKQKKHFRAYH